MADRLFVFRPLMAEPQMCSASDLNSWMTLDDLLDMHELMDLKDEMMRKSMAANDRSGRK